MVNEMFLSIKFIMSWKAETSSFSRIQKLSSTYLFQIFGGTDELLITDSSISSMQRLATGLPIAELAMDLLVNFVIEHKIVVGQGELKKIGDDINVQICS